MLLHSHWDRFHTLMMVKRVHACHCHLFWISFQISFQFGTYLFTMQYDHSKRTLDYILIILDLEKVEVVCTFQPSTKCKLPRPFVVLVQDDKNVDHLTLAQCCSIIYS